MITDPNAELHGTTSPDNLNPSGWVKFNSGDQIKSDPKFFYELCSPSITQFLMKSSPNTLN